MHPGRMFAMIPLQYLLAVDRVTHFHFCNFRPNLHEEKDVVNSFLILFVQIKMNFTGYKATQCGENAWKQWNNRTSCNLYNVV